MCENPYCKDIDERYPKNDKKTAYRASPDDDTDAHVIKAGYLLSTGKVDEGIIELKEAIVKDPNNALAHFDLGLVYRKLGQVDEGIAEYHEAIRIEPNNSRYHNNLGAALLVKGDYKAASDALKKSIEKDESDPVAHFNLGFAYDMMTDFISAKKEYEEAVRLKSDFQQAKFYLQLLKLKRADKNE